MISDIKSFIEKYESILPLGKSISVPEAERRASEFLSAMAHVTNVRHLLSESKIKAISLQSAVFAQEVNKGTDKTVTVNKMNAEASPEYVAAREDLEGVENDLAYLKAYYDIFMAAHVFYRNLAKGDGV